MGDHNQPSDDEQHRKCDRLGTSEIIVAALVRHRFDSCVLCQQATLKLKTTLNATKCTMEISLVETAVMTTSYQQ